MKLIYTVILPAKKDIRQFRTLAIIGVKPGKESTQAAEQLAGRLATSLWGAGCTISLTDVELDVQECSK